MDAPRAGPPPHGEPERYDMLLLDEWIREGWVEHVLFRDVRRMARKSLPAEVLIDRSTSVPTVGGLAQGAP